MTNQTIDRRSWLRRLFWNPPSEPEPESPKKAGLSFHINTCGSRIEADGRDIRFVDDPSAICGELTCPVCKGIGPMTPERAVKINQRFLQERGYDQPND